MTGPRTPGLVLLVGGTPADVARLGDLPGVEQCSPAQLEERLAVPERVDVVVIGSGVPGAIGVVQRTRVLAPDAGVAVLAADSAAVRRQASFAPGVPLDLLVIDVADETAADRLGELRRTRARRRRHAAVLAAVVRHADGVGRTDVVPVTDVGTLLEHAPMAVLVAGPSGDLRGWNRRAEDLFALRPAMSGRSLEVVVPGAGALLAAAASTPVAAEPAVVQLRVGSADVELSVVPSLGPDGAAVSLVIATDVTAHRRAERERDRLTEQVALLGRVSEVLTQSLDVSRSLALLAGVLVPALADWVSIQVREEHQQLVDVVVRHRDPNAGLTTRAAEDLLRRTRSVTAVGRAAAGGTVVVLPEVDVDALVGSVEEHGLRTVLARLGVASALAVPLSGRSGVLGSLLLVRDEGRSGFADADSGLAVEIGRRAGVALDNASLYARQRHLATELQQSLLTHPPTLDFADLAVRYVAAGRQAQVGGDWYDAFRQRGGDLTLVIGDVAGHDTRAAAEMGQLRALVRGISFTTAEGPQRTLTAVDAAMEGLDLSTVATALVAQLTPPGPSGEQDGLRFRWSSAGHPPPVLVHADGRAMLLEPEGGKADLLLGVNAASTRRTTWGLLPAGSTLLLYTDGLIEKRDQSIDDGLALLLTAVQEHAGAGLDEFCDQVLMAMVPHAGEDDVALVAVRPRGAAQPPPPPEPGASAYVEAVRASWRGTSSAPHLPLLATLPLTTLRELGHVRRRLRTILVDSLRAAGLTDGDVVDDVVDRSILVIDELASNALRHGAAPAELQVCDGGDHWVVAAVDSAPDALPRPAVDRPAGLGGYGLYVVADLALAHGVEVDGPKKRVWAVLGTRPA